MLDKTLHFCWFGKNKKSEIMLKCIESWKKFLPGWTIKEWNDDNVSEIDSPFFRAAIKSEKWAFAADYARIWVLYNYGGIYFDVDVEMIKPLDDIWDKIKEQNFIIGTELFDDNVSIGCGFMGGKKGNIVCKDLLEKYDTENFLKPNQRFNMTPMPKRLAEYFKDKYDIKLDKNNNEIIDLEDKVKIYPYMYFTPNENKVYAYTIHHFADSWNEDWGVRTWINTKYFRLHILRQQKEFVNSKFPLLKNEKIIFAQRISSNKVLVLVRLIKDNTSKKEGSNG